MKILLVGYGYMGKEYEKILLKNDVDFTIVTRSLKNVNTSKKILYGGIENIDVNDIKDCTHAIITSPIEFLEKHLDVVINYGILNVLIEKPGCLNTENVKKHFDKNVYVAYNRRFYPSVTELIDHIWKDGGILSFNMNITELISKMDPSKYDKQVLEKWFLAMTSHVIDLAFFICGDPIKMTCEYKSTNSLKWHKNEIFIGHGITKNNLNNDVLFSYHGNWLSGGRWRIEICTKKAMYILCPLEELHVQFRGDININKIEIDNNDEFKCGLSEMVYSFLFHDTDIRLLTLKKQCENIDNIYNKMSGPG